ncbi:CCT motif [Musa troglodytarum]|uniref:CCT motif n=1 Tax=Musa troglodytarum TaxID=320322 RepID=A0A9E7IDI6_9LILI|nr:CCT motif [Musa troglodytarum]
MKGGRRDNLVSPWGVRSGLRGSGVVSVRFGPVDISCSSWVPIGRARRVHREWYLHKGGSEDAPPDPSDAQLKYAGRLARFWLRLRVIYRPGFAGWYRGQLPHGPGMKQRRSDVGRSILVVIEHRRGNDVVQIRVGRYSAEERKERIERYKSKRNQRNFHKKITVSTDPILLHQLSFPLCRRSHRAGFARNGETGTEAEVETATAATNIFDGYSHDNYEQNQGCSVGGGNDGEWGSRFQESMATGEEEEYSYDEDLLASFTDVFSMNILS